jgi:hypothetical protein
MNPNCTLPGFAFSLPWKSSWSTYTPYIRRDIKSKSGLVLIAQRTSVERIHYMIISSRLST